MYNHVSVIPEDQAVIVDGLPLNFNFTAPAELRALQWHAGSGHVEYADGRENRPLSGAEYAREVAPYAALWEAEKARIEAEMNRPLALPEARAQALAALRAKRLEVEYGGFDFNGQRWDSSEKDELRLNSIIKAFEMTGQTEFPGWKVADGLYITLTPEIAQGAALALMQRYARVFQIEAVKIAQIEALQTAEAVLTWQAEEMNSGW